MDESRLAKWRWRIQRLFDRNDFSRYFPGDPQDRLSPQSCRGPVLNVFRRVRDNIGDAACPPAWYFFRGVKTLDLRRCSASDIPRDANVIIGGGGLITERYYDRLRMLRQCSRKAVLWGIGANHTDRRTPSYPDFLAGFDLAGVRDRGCGFDWVPCPSCMLKELDRPRQATREMVVYEHKHAAIDVPGVPRLSNTEWRISRVLDFLGSAQVVLTSSYHGVYWSVLLRRKVVAVNPFSSKFFHFPYPVPIANQADFGSRIKEARVYPEALGECREANRRFARRVLDLFCS
jgi:hypothetical protein